MNILGIKLVSGEELIVQVVKEELSLLTIKNPFVVIINGGKSGDLGINLFPWTLIAEGEIELNAAGIVARFPLPKDVEDNYIQNTTNLQIVSGVPSQILKG